MNFKYVPDLTSGFLYAQALSLAWQRSGRRSRVREFFLGKGSERGGVAAAMLGLGPLALPNWNCQCARLKLKCLPVRLHLQSYDKTSFANASRYE